jgi:hypothetical protein
MPLAVRHRDDPTPSLPLLDAFHVERETSPAAMAALQGRTLEEMTRRFSAGHRPYVARWNGQTAAWGWVATREADIGELGSSFAIAAGERYLWNFVTLASHRGLGIYPRLLDAIVRAESREAERFWIAYAPENHASGTGIRKAGFVNVAELSFDPTGQPALQSLLPGGGTAAVRLLRLPVTSDALAKCWRCARSAARREMSCAAGSCRCDYQQPKSGCAA